MVLTVGENADFFQVTLGIVILTRGMGLGGGQDLFVRSRGRMENFGEKSLKWVHMHRKSMITR